MDRRDGAGGRSARDATVAGAHVLYAVIQPAKHPAPHLALRDGL